MMSKEDMNIVKEEVDRLIQLDHPHIAKYYEWYENKKQLCVVSEFIADAQPLQQLVENGTSRITEREISIIMKQLFEAIVYLNKNAMMHRNIIPSNVMVDNNLNVKLIDFGIAKLTDKCKHTDTTKDIAQFTAPESYHGDYTILSDVWSLGNLTYLLFAGKLPFSGANVMSTFKKSTNRAITFKSSVWSEVSMDAKNMIKDMIKGNPTERISPEDLLKHSWFKYVDELVYEVEEEKVSVSTLRKLQTFQFTNELQKIFLIMLVNMLLDDEEFYDHQKQFNLCDKDHDGMITVEELFNSYNQSSVKISKDECEKIIDKLDFAGKKAINFTEFLVATLNRSELMNETIIHDLFMYFDSDDDKKIWDEDIFRELQAVDNNVTREQLHDLVDKHAKKFRNCITYDEFEKILIRSGMSH